ncbi:restriction endonuclease subunit S [Tenacibaculum dicentrarchi]|uniref:restriction endonuclease subunit S n=1 Tax=Tenacibaculum dicentrarchi TaxID=669041 RepID=UPI0035135432
MDSKLPKNWVEIKLDEIVLSKKGKKPKILNEVEFEGSVPYLDIKAFEKNEIRRYADVESSNLIKETEIGIVWDGARSGWVSKGKKGAVGSTIAIIKPINTNSDFLYRFLQSKFEYLNSNTRGTGIPHVDPKILWSIDFPLPPLAEQQRIVAKLDTLFGSLDALKIRLNNIPQLIKNFKQAVLTQAVTGKLTQEWRVGKELEEWEETTVGQFMIEVKNKMNPIESDVTNYIGLEHLLKNGGIINHSTSENLKSSKTVFKKGDVLYGKLRPYLNKHYVVTFDGICSTDILVYRNDFEKSSHFFNYYLGTENFISKANSESKGINLPRVSSKTINQFNINVPPKEEQTEIVKRVENLFSKADAIEKQYKTLKEKIDRLPQAILAKAFKGELVAQLPTDGDAKDLLEEIKKLKESLVVKPKKKVVRNKK